MMKIVVLFLAVIASHNTFGQSDSSYYRILSDTYCFCSTTLDRFSKISGSEKNDNCYGFLLDRFITDSGMDPLYEEYPQVPKSVVDSIFRLTMSEFLMENIKPYLVSNCTYYNKERLIDSLVVDRSDKKEIKKTTRQLKKRIKHEKELSTKARYSIFIGLLYEANRKYKKALSWYDKSLMYRSTTFGNELKEEVLQYIN